MMSIMENLLFWESKLITQKNVNAVRLTLRRSLAKPGEYLSFATSVTPLTVLGAEQFAFVQTC